MPLVFSCRCLLPAATPRPVSVVTPPGPLVKPLRVHLPDSSTLSLPSYDRLPTPIQAEAVPLILGGGDVMAAAETGSGKTGAFALPVLQIGEQSSVG